jgi:hypothetical protein
MAILHMATPAVPPAMIIAPRFNWDGSDPAGVKAFLATSYAAKYLSRVMIINSQSTLITRKFGSRSAPRSISRQCSTGSPEDAAYAAFTIEDFDDVPHAFILFLLPALALNLQEHLCTFYRCSDKGGRYSREKPGNSKLRCAQSRRLPVWRCGNDDVFGEIIRLSLSMSKVIK